MTSSQTFSILFWVNNSRAKEGLAEIYARIVVNGRRANISLKTKINPEHWDKSKGRLRTKDKGSLQVNGFIEQTRTQIFQCYMDLKASGSTFTAQSLKARFLGEDQDHKSMTELIAYHNEKMQPKLHYDTMRHFKTSQNYIMEYIQKEYKCSDILLKDLDYKFVIGFESFLRSYKPKHYRVEIGNNTVMKHIQRLRKMVRMAFHMEWIEKDPFIKFKPKLIKKEREFLAETELERLENLSCSITRLTNVKDLFLFSCYTGIAYGDIMLLTKNNIVEGEDGNLWIETNRKKTATPVKVPLLPQALEIIEKYKDDYRTSITKTLLPVLSNQKVNSYLKEIAYLSKIKKHLTFHMARHTFATTVTLTNGVPLETVSKLLGHTKLTTTQIYARVIEKKVSEDMNELMAKMHKRKAAL
jgi:integrase/recombinase XerD